MKYDKDVPKKLWIYNDKTGSLTRKTVVFRVNDIESWYEDPKGWPTYDPFYIDEDKEALVDRVHKNLSGDLQETLSQAERLIAFIKKLTQKYN